MTDPILTITRATLAEAVDAFEIDRAERQAHGQDFGSITVEHSAAGVTIRATIVSTEGEDA